jgi:hypothetical protein
MPVDPEGQRSPRLLRQGRATSGQGQALRGGNPGISIAAWSGCRYARGGKFPLGRQDQEYLPRLLTRIRGWTPCRLIQINAVGRDQA